MRILSLLKWSQKSDGKPWLLLMSSLVVFVFFLSFLIGFFTSFPDAVLRDRLLSEVNLLLPPGNRLEAETVELVFPLQLQVSRSRLIMDSAPLPEVLLSTVSLSPTLATLIGRPGLHVSALSEYGLLEGTVAQTGEVDLHLRSGRFDLPIPEMKQLQLSGVISSLDLVGQLQAGEGESLRFDTELNELFLNGTSQLGIEQNRLSLGQLSISLAGTGRALKIEQLSLDGGELSVAGNGRIVIQQPLDASRLELSLQVRPNSGADSSLRNLLELLGPAGKNGSHTLQLRGRLLAPQLR